MRSSIEATDLLVLDTLVINEVQREEFTPPIGESGTDLTLSIQAEFTAHYILAEDLKTLASSSVTASIPVGFLPSGEMTFSPLEAPITDATGITRFPLQASQATLREVDMMQVFNLIRGRDVQTAADVVQNTLALQNEPQIVITPSWWRWLPLIPFNISVEVGR